MSHKKECPSCAMEIKASSKVCPICGYEFPATSYWTQIIAIILILLFLYLAFIR